MATVRIPYKPYTAKHAELHRIARRFTVPVVHRRGGKTVWAINHLGKMAAQCKLKNPQYAYIAPKYIQAKRVAWQYLKDFYGAIPGIKFNESELLCQWPNGVKIYLLGANNEEAVHSLRGMYFDGVVIDEVAQCPAALWGEIIRPALSDRQGWCVFIGTPNGRDHFWEKYEYAVNSGDPEWLGVHWPVTETGVFGTVYPEGELESAKKAMSQAEFEQEYMCSFEASGEFILIPQALITEAIDRQINYAHAPLVAGLDVGMSLGNDPSALVIRQGGKIVGAYQIHLDNTNAIAGWAWGKMSWHGCRTVVVDALTWGKGVADVLPTLGAHTIPINVGQTAAFKDAFPRRRDELWWKAREWFDEKQCCIPSSLEYTRQLVGELSGVTYTRLPSGKIKVMGKDEMRSEKGKSPNLADALCYSLAEEGTAPAGLAYKKPQFIAA